LADHINKTFKPGIETLEAKYFSFDEIPWTQLAFPSVGYSLRKYIRKTKKSPIFYTFKKD